MVRDPKIDPQPGDVLTLENGKFRHVLRRNGYNIVYTTKPQSLAVEKICWISTWQTWCQNQEFASIMTR
jgi:hypothetical protein